MKPIWILFLWWAMTVFPAVTGAVPAADGLYITLQTTDGPGYVATGALKGVWE